MVWYRAQYPVCSLEIKFCLALEIKNYAGEKNQWKRKHLRKQHKGYSYEWYRWRGREQEQVYWLNKRTLEAKERTDWKPNSTGKNVESSS